MKRTGTGGGAHSRAPQKIMPQFSISLGITTFSGVFIAFLPLWAKVVITEIGAYEKTDSEWIEIFNSGPDSVDITDWKFYEGTTNHGLSAFQGDLNIEPGEFAVIAQKADIFLQEKNFSGTLLDSSWGTLKEDGEEIGLKDGAGNALELFTYIGAPNFSLERVNPDNSDFGSANWKEHPAGNTAGYKNSVWEYTPPQETSPSQADTPPSPPGSSGGGGSISSPREGDVVINEFVSDPADGEEEWIELFNKSSNAVALDGWSLEEGSERKTPLSGILLSRGFFVIEKPVGNLNNTGDSIFLKDPRETIIDQVTYGEWQDQNQSDNAALTSDPESLARISDGYDSNNDREDFRPTQTPTRGKSNLIAQKSSGVSRDYSHEVKLNEIYPNPPGADEGEFIEIINLGASEVLLDGWKLGDATAHRYEIHDARIGSGGILVFDRSLTRIAQNNSGRETISLYSPDDSVTDALSYEGVAPEGKSYSQTDGGRWHWSLRPTPGEKNIIEKENEPPAVSISGPKKAYTGEILSFDGSDSYDPDGDELQFFWDFGDGRVDSRMSPFQVYAHRGLYEITLTAGDEKNSSSTARHLITVFDRGAPSSTLPSMQSTDTFPDVFISEFLPNPAGDDATGEFIELYNPLDAPRDISGWSLDDSEGGSRPYTIPKGTILEPNGYGLFVRDETEIALNNSSDAVRLFDSFGEMRDEAPYASVFEGASFIRNPDSGWDMTSVPTPGEINVLNAVAKNSQKNLSSASEKEAAENSATRLEGIALVEPGILGSQILYIADNTGGIQLYMYTKNWPKISAGDTISALGKLSSSRGEPRLKISQREDINIIRHSKPPEARAIKTFELESVSPGTLVRLEGEITESKGYSFSLDDGTDEARGYIKKSSGIKKEFTSGDSVSLTGIAVKNDSGWQILPRYQNDIRVAKVLGDALAQKTPEQENSPAGGIPRSFLSALVLIEAFIILHLANIIKKLQKPAKP